jgi:polyhydroxybutyrate depolymerase
MTTNMSGRYTPSERPTAAQGSTAAPGSTAAGMTRWAAIAGLAAPLAWAAAAILELLHANIGHSITARPERLFSDSAFHLPIVALVVATIVCQFAAGFALARASRPSRPAVVAIGALAVAGLARVAMAVLLPSDPNGYSVSAGAALCATVTIGAAIVAMAAAAYLPRSGGLLAWLSWAVAPAILAVALWATVWASVSGASEPQLLAVEPVEFLLSVWAAAAGASLLGRAGLFGGRSARLPRLPLSAVARPGRKAALLFPVLAAAILVVTAGGFVQSYRPVVEAQLAGRVQVERLHADAVDRTVRVYRPASELAKPGLVIVLHGSFGGGFRMEADSGFDAQADRLGWVAAYPDGVADGWDTFGSTDKWGQHPGADDVEFISNLIDRLEASDAVDPNRVYVTGLSRGGMMTYRLGCELSDRIAAIAPVSGNMATVAGSADVPCTLSRPVSVFAIHGTADGVIPIGGGKVDITYSPFADVIARWRSMDGCGGDIAGTATDGPSTTTTWSCSAGTTVEQRVVTGGGHTWPRVLGKLASDGGWVDSFDASRLIADFFVSHPRTPAGT